MFKNFSKLYFLLVCSLFLLANTVFSQKDDKKWDVSDPAKTGGLAYTEAKFAVSEGTWMNLDVSPDGKTILFDLLGDIYKISVSGGEATCLRSGLAWEVQPRFSPDGTKILYTSDGGGGDNIWMMDADGSKPTQITKETFRLLNNADWIDNQWIVARKHFTSSRSLGAGEMWMYHISGGEGLQLTKRKNDQQDVNEPSVSRNDNGRYIYYSEDLYPGGFFQYNKDPNDQIFAIRRYDREEGKTEDITGGSGGACRPQISPDGKWLSFVRRHRAKTMLCLQNLETAEEFVLFEGLDKDQQEAWTVFGCYPRYAWMPQTAKGSGEIVIWFGGKLNKIAFSQSKLGEKEAVSVSNIPFTCQVKTPLTETVRSENKVFEKEFTARAIRQTRTSPDGKWLAFNAAGQLYLKKLPDGTPKLLLKNAWRAQDGKKTDDLTALQNAFEPAFLPDGNEIVFTVWDDDQLGKISKINLQTNEVRDLTTLKGIFRTPVFSADGKMIVFKKDDGDDEHGFAHSKKSGIYTMNADGSDLKFVAEGGENPFFSPDGKRIFVQTGGSLFGGLDKSLKSFDLDGKDEKTHFKSKYATNWAVSHDAKWLAFTELHKAYVCAIPETGKTIDLSADTKSMPATQVSRDAGYNLHWSRDDKKLHYTLGEEYFSIDLNERFLFVPGAPDSLPALDTSGIRIGLKLETDLPQKGFVLSNVRIITMKGEEVIENGVVVIGKNKIVFVGTAEAYKTANLDIKNAVNIDFSGKTIMPGIIDVHAHSGNFRFGLNPQKQWEYHANLAYGVTTMHDPSTNSEMAFSNSEMLKSGRMIGPRLFSTGTILYGADGDFKAPINSLDDARSTLRRTKAWGAFSVKSYNQPRRDQRQQVMAAAKELNMLVVPEGGSFFYHNLTQVADGHTGVEHNLPVAPLYNDVIEFWSRTKAHNTPTLIVNYGGLNGENYFYQTTDVWKKERLLKFTPRHILDERSRHITKAPMEEYEFGHILVSKSCKKLQDAGANINLGAHGQLQGLGAHWELWMLVQGGMSNHQALRCATMNGAKYLGMDKEIGSIEVGKLADLLILDKNPLEEITNSESIKNVIINGRFYKADDLTELFGEEERVKSAFWFEKVGSQTIGTMSGHTCGETKCVCGH